jgi:hypothetical protein
VSRLIEQNLCYSVDALSLLSMYDLCSSKVFIVQVSLWADKSQSSFIRVMTFVVTEFVPGDEGIACVLKFRVVH